MSLQRYEDIVYNQALTPVSTATVSVAGTGGLASLFDENSNPIANPVITDGNGHFYFYAVAGSYTLTVSGGAPPISPVFVEHVTLASDGATGAQGPQGIQGIQGPPGTAPIGAGNLVLATPDGGAGSSALRALVSNDLPALAEAEITGLVSDLAAKAAITYVDTQDAAEVTARAAAITTEATARSTADGLLAPKANPTFTGTVNGITAAMVGADAAGVATAAVATEVTNRNTAIGVEQTRALAAEALLASSASVTAAISTAETFATAADTTAIAAEVTNRNSAITTAVATETTNRTTADGLLAPKTTTVNGHALSANVVVSASDLTTGTLPHAQLPSLVSGDIPANAANTSGTAGGLSANIAESQVTSLTSDLAAKAPLASPTFTGTVNAAIATFAGLLTVNAVTGYMKLVNATPGTVSTTNGALEFDLECYGFHGGASAVDRWAIYSQLAAGTDALSTLYLSHTTGAGAAVVQVPALALGSAGTPLANYAEGTWTPTPNADVTSHTTGTVVVTGTYTRIGRLVFFNIAVSVHPGAGLTLTANASAYSLPPGLTPARSAACQQATIGGGGATSGTGCFAYGDGNVWPASEVVSANVLLSISGVYEV